MKNLLSSKVLSAALIATALAAVGTVPASAQALSHDGSLMPHYFDKDGELKWGGWAPPAAEHLAVARSHQAAAPSRQAAAPSRSLYLSAKQHAHRSHVS
jgi:hypothetical protein